MKLVLTISGTLEGPVSIGTLCLIKVLQRYLGLGLVDSKSLIDRAVFGGETIEVQIPEGTDIDGMLGDIKKIETPGEIVALVSSQ